MNSIKLKKYNEIFKEYKNNGSGNKIEYDNILNKIDSLLKSLNKNLFIIDGKIIFSLVYKQIPFKSNKISI